MAVLWSETWSYANGTAPATVTLGFTGTGGATAAVQNTKYRLTTGGIGSAGKITRRAQMPSVADSETRGAFTLTSTTGDYTTSLIARGDTALDGQNGYSIDVRNNAGTVTWQVVRANNYAYTTLLASGANGLTATNGTTVNFAFRLEGASIRAKLWTGTAEPGAWQLDVTDSAPYTTVGAVGFALGAVTGTLRQVDFGAVTISTPITALVVDAGPDQTGVSGGDMVFLSATSSSGEIPAWSQTGGSPTVTLLGSGANRSFRAPGTTTGTILTFTAAVTGGSDTMTVNVLPHNHWRFNASKVLVARYPTNLRTATDTTGGPTGEPTNSATSLYAGHIPKRVLVGYAAPDNGTPSWAQARTMIQTASTTQTGTAGVGAYERRRFSSTATAGTDATELRSMLADGDAASVYNWVSFKVTGTDWAGVAAGSYPAIPGMFRTVALERRAAGKAPFMATLHHEPRGDGNLSDWAAMHVYMSTQLADVNDMLAWSAIGNGFLWALNTTTYVADRTAMFPQSLVTTFRDNRSVVAVDTYDDHPTYTGQTTTPSITGTRTSVKLQNWITAMRGMGCGALGIGEWGTVDATEMANTASVFWANRDVLGIANYFNSGANSDWDWRLVRDDYPVQDAGNPIDYGGTPLTEGRLNYFAVMLRDSTLPVNTG